MQLQLGKQLAELIHHAGCEGCAHGETDAGESGRLNTHGGQHAESRGARLPFRAPISMSARPMKGPQGMQQLSPGLRPHRYIDEQQGHV